jgi:hypothetical protein
MVRAGADCADSQLRAVLTPLSAPTRKAHLLWPVGGILAWGGLDGWTPARRQATAV